ncbi:GNAT family N-acetyltransferase [Budvicia diplopodorum]|uniref:GNAT family N-acetyltransferase n=1 Tax=Budvicia diplopodorum TaxID=1119056 RepID=UPI001356E7AB|nr:GNAT family N-acetyltransferase [Budvicia diplopodorum]
MKLQKLFGWKECSFHEYKQAYAKFGGNLSSEPRILEFFHKHHDLNENFFTKKNDNGELIGAICSWENGYISGEQKIAKKHNLGNYLLNFDEVMPPIKKDSIRILPFKTKYLSAINSRNIMNSSHFLDANREISIVNNVSSKTRNSRNRELRKFIDSGGSIRKISEYDINSLLPIYEKLYFQRRGTGAGTEGARNLLSEIPDLLFGSVLEMHGEPCAMQWITKSEDHQRIYLDYVNAGMNMELKHLSVGTIIAWINVRDAIDYGTARNKEVRFSFGRPSADYKERWCTAEPLSRVFA